jgi:hypothetical protein
MENEEHCRVSWSTCRPKILNHKKLKKPFLKLLPRYYLFCCWNDTREISSTPCCSLFNSVGGGLSAHFSCADGNQGVDVEQLHPGFLNSPIFCVCVHCVCVVIVSGRESHSTSDGVIILLPTSHSVAVHRRRSIAPPLRSPFFLWRQKPSAVDCVFVCV